MPTPTMSDIAEKCGVSAMTISYVLNRKDGVSDATRQRVIKTLNEMGYAFNPNASRLSKLKSKKVAATKSVGCILGKTANKYADPYFGEIIETVEKELIAKGYHLMFVHSWSDLKADPLLRASSLSKNIIDGVIAICLDTSDIEELQRDVGAIVAVDSNSPISVDSITNDNYQGGLLATAHLIELGHRNIVYIGHKFTGAARTDRIDGYRAALNRANLPIDENLIFHTDLSVGGGLAAVKDLLARDVKFTAVFAHNDAIACGVVKGLKRAKFRVPKDVSVVGYNNDFVAELMDPEITTISVDKRNLGRLAASEIIERINQSDTPPRKQVLPVSLLVRETTAKI